MGEGRDIGKRRGESQREGRGQAKQERERRKLHAEWKSMNGRK